MLKDLINIILTILKLEELLILSPKNPLIKFYSFLNINKASADGKLYTVKYLFQNGVKPTYNSINYASAYGHLEVVKYLFENDINPTSDAINWAIETRHLDVVDYLKSKNF